MTQQFKFYQDAKCTIWQRSHFTIAAGSREAAVEKLKVLKNEDLNEYEDKNIRFVESEILFDTAKSLTPEENWDCATLKIFNDRGDYITGNGKQLLGI